MGKNESPLKQIRTFQGDVAEALKKQQESLVSIQRAEQLKRGGPRAETETTSWRSGTFYIIGAVILLVLGGGGGYFAYSVYERGQTTEPIATPANKFIYTGKEISLELDLGLEGFSRENFANLLSQAISEASEAKSTHIVINKKGPEKQSLLTTEDFLVLLLGSRAPGSLVRALEPIFMLGTLDKSVFLILRLDSFENTFAGMLAWEKNMAEDLKPVFTSGEGTGLPNDTIFVDIVDRNKNIRALESEGEVSLLYSFFENDTLIITDKIEALRTIIERLTQEKLSH